MGIKENSMRDIRTILHILVLFGSLALIVAISLDTFEGVDFLESRRYMTFQFWVCVLFLITFFIELFMSDDRWHFIKHNWLFLLVSIPYLNIIELFNLNFSHDTLYFIRFIPLVRGAVALTIVIGYMTDNKLTSLLASYVTIMIAVIYFASLIFLDREQPVNNMVPNYGAALWWACMDATTIGSNIYPVTVVGKILAVIVAAMGMMMFPLFTVYITSLVQRYNKRTYRGVFALDFFENGPSGDDKIVDKGSI